MQPDQLKRREFITLIGGAAAAWPLGARAQRASIRRVGVLLTGAESDPDYQVRVAAFREGLEKLGWLEGRNIRMDVRWGAGAPDRMRVLAAELVEARADVLFAGSIPTLTALQKATRTIPIVFAQVPDPIANGLVASLARPGGNITGFANYEQSIAVKWLELLKQLVPHIMRVALLYDPGNPAGEGYVRVAGAAASSFGVQLSGAAVHNPEEITRAVDALAREPNGGLIVLPSPAVTANRDLVITLAARHRLPTVSPFRDYAAAGVLASYGVDNIELFRRAASYVDRILKGEKPGDLPVQMATKFELVINLKTAKLLGIEVPIVVLARTDEVIE